jgi:hypothetical protein
VSIKNFPSSIASPFCYVIKLYPFYYYLYPYIQKRGLGALEKKEKEKKEEKKEEKEK